jgi:hypothetical protein
MRHQPDVDSVRSGVWLQGVWLDIELYAVAYGWQLLSQAGGEVKENIAILGAADESETGQDAFYNSSGLHVWTFRLFDLLAENVNLADYNQKDRRPSMGAVR